MSGSRKMKRRYRADTSHWGKLPLRGHRRYAQSTNVSRRARRYILHFAAWIPRDGASFLDAKKKAAIVAARSKLMFLRRYERRRSSTGTMAARIWPVESFVNSS